MDISEGRVIKDGPPERGEELPLTQALKELTERVRLIVQSKPFAQLAPEALSALKRLIFETPLSIEDWLPFVWWREDRYARNLLEQCDGACDVLLVAWMPGQTR